MGAARSDALSRTLSIGLPALIAAAPLPFGGRTPQSSSLICAAAAVLALCALAYRLRDRRSGSAATPAPPAALALAGLLLLVLLQLVPLPAQLLGLLNPSALAIRQRAALGASISAGPLSLNAGSTLAAFGRLSAALAVFAAASTLAARPGGTRRIAWGLCAAGLIEALYGLVDLTSGRHRIFTYTREAYVGRLTGTYINPNHFAGLLELALPAAIGLALYPIGERGGVSIARTPGLRRRLSRLLSDPASGRRRALGLGIGLMAAALLFSRSRAGIALAGACCLSLLLLGGRSEPARTRRGSEGLMGARSAARRLGWFASALAIVLLSLAPLAVDEFSRLTGTYQSAPTDFLAPGGRGEVWRCTLPIFFDHPLSGTGLGTFKETFPRYRAPEIAAAWEEAHNDYLQVLAETGLLGAALAAAALLAAAVAARRSISAEAGDPSRPLRLALGFGCLTLLVHEVIDFNLQIPANAIAFAASAAGCLVRAAPNAPRPVEPQPAGSRRPGGIWPTVLLAALAAAGALLGCVHPEDGSPASLRRAQLRLVESDERLANAQGEDPTAPAREARALLRELSETDPASPDVHLTLARLERRAALFGLEDPPSREWISSRLSLASALDPYRPDLRLGILRERVAMGDAEGALGDLSAISTRGGDPVEEALPVVWPLVPDPDRIGRALFGARSTGFVEDQGSGWTDARYIFADFLLRAGRRDEGEKRLREILHAGPSVRAAAYARLAPLLVERGDAAEAVSLGEEILRGGSLAAGDAASVLLPLADCLVDIGSAGRATPLMHQAVLLLPDQPGIRQRAANVYLAAGDPEDAARELEFLLRGGAPTEFVRSHEVEMRKSLARSYEGLGRPEAAIREWREVAGLDPDDRDAQDRIWALSRGF